MKPLIPLTQNDIGDLAEQMQATFKLYGYEFYEEKVKNEVKRPLMRYYGGKWRIAPWVISFFPKHSTYVELYAGAASVLLRKEKAPKEICNDLCGLMVNFFKVLADEELSKNLVDRLRLTPYSREVYYQKMGTSPIDKAAWVFINGGMGFGSTTPNKVAGFVYQGKNPAGSYFGTVDGLDAAINRLRGVIFENRPAMRVLKDNDDEGVLFYADPPYFGVRKGEDAYYKHQMNEPDHEELAMSLLAAKGFAVLSGYENRIYDSMRGLKKFSKEAFTGNRKKSLECVWVTEKTLDALRSSDLPISF